MFKSWRNDKKKIKAVFQLQFQATQVPRLKKPALIISLVPEDVGKTTFKLEKAPVENGTCSWEKPLFVSVKLIRQPKTGYLKEKIFHFIVSSGTSKSGYLGEASIDFADFAEETQPITVSLPLKFANSGAILNVTVQRVQGGTNERDVEGDEGSLSQDESLKNRLSDPQLDTNNSFNEESNLDVFSSHNDYENGSFKASVGSNASIQSTPRQNSMPREAVLDSTATRKQLHRRSSTDWSLGSASNGSLADSANSPEDYVPRESRGDSDESIEKLKSEIASLMRQSELSELEIQSLRKQFAKENRRAQDLSRQIVDLKEERDQFKTECIQLRSHQKSFDGEALTRLKAENKDAKAQLEEIRRELSHEKELNNNLKLQLEKTQESNSELILAVNDLDEMLEQKKTEISHLSLKLELNGNSNDIQDKKCKCYMQEYEDRQTDPELEELATERNDCSELSLLKEKIAELSDEIKLYREDREKLENYVEQLTQENADLQHENHERLEQQRILEVDMQNESMKSLTTIEGLELQVERLEEKLKKQTQELSESLDSISELESQVKALEKELEKQAQAFENDLDAMTCAKIEQEQRAIRAEEALRKTRWKNAVTAERLQEEFKRLSVEMAGKFDENEKQMRKAMAEADELRVQNRTLEDQLQKADEELEQSRTKEEKLSNQLKAASQKQEELEETKASLEETDMLVKKWRREREELERNFALAKKESEKAQGEILNLRSLKGEKEMLVEKLLSEAESLKSRQAELKSSLSKEEQEKEHFQKLVLELRQELKSRKPADDISPYKGDDSNLNELMREMSQLKERNKSMESELKEMQGRYSEISLKFAEVEGERQQLVMTVRNLKSGKKS